MLELIRSLRRSDLEERLRRSVSYAYLGDTTVVCRVLGQSVIYVDTSDIGLAPHLIMDGFWEIWITQAMARCLQPGMTAVDVGANFGYYTLLMGEAVGKQGKVISFEPNVRMAKLLKRSLAVNGMLGHGYVDMRAAYEVGGKTLEFFIPHATPMNSALVEVWHERMIGIAGDVIKTETVRLDDVLPGRVDFIKLDVEGVERQVWSGLQKTLKNNKDIQVFIEFNRAKYPETAVQFLEELLAPGFILRYVDDDGEMQRCDREYALSKGKDDIILYLCRN